MNRAAELVEGDIRDASSIGDAFEGVDTVFHVAALPRIPLSIAKPVETHMTNVVGTLNVLIAARDRKVRRVVFSGSSSVYGEQAKMPLVETMTPNPLNPYALQKYVGEQYARMFHRLFAMQTITLRYFGVYGPRMPSEGSYVLAVAAFLKARREGRPLEIFGDGEQTRDFTHVSDVVSANMLAMDCEIRRRARDQYRAWRERQRESDCGDDRRADGASRRARRATCAIRWRIARRRSGCSDGVRGCRLRRVSRSC